MSIPREKIAELLREQTDSYKFDFAPRIKGRVLGNALMSFARDCSSDNVVALYNANFLFGAGKSGALVSTEGIYCDTFDQCSERDSGVTFVPFHGLCNVERADEVNCWRMTYFTGKTLSVYFGDLTNPLIPFLFEVEKEEALAVMEPALRYYDDKNSPLYAPEKAVAIWKKAYAYGFEALRKGAAYNLGLAYFNGCGVPRDKDKGIEYMMNCAEMGNQAAAEILNDVAPGWNLTAEQCLKEGLNLKEQERFTEAADYFLSGTQKGSRSCMYHLGKLYRYGNGVEKDFKLAIKYFTQAADLGEVQAAADLGWIYLFALSDDEEAPVLCQKYLRQAAAGGSADSMYCLGYCYNFGNGGVEEDRKEAFQWHLKAAKAGQLFSMRSVGECYLKGDGTPRDLKQAAYWLEKAVDMGYEQVASLLENVREQMKLEPARTALLTALMRRTLRKLLSEFSENRLKAEEYPTAVEFFSLFSEKDSRAAYALAKMYQTGLGVKKDPQQAYRYMKSAATAGHIEACFEVYQQLTADDAPWEERRDWLMTAVKGGNPKAMVELGWLCRRGEHIKRDIEAASALFRAAAQLGSDRAKEELEALASESPLLEQLRDMAQSQADACNKLSMRYLTGSGVLMNVRESSYYKKRGKEIDCMAAMVDIVHTEFLKNGRGLSEMEETARELGLGVALYELAEIYNQGLGVARDVRKAISLWKAAFDVGYLHAAFEIGRVYIQGDGIEENPALGAEWFRKGAAKRESDCTLMLGFCYKEGDGVPQAQNLAEAYYRSAVKLGNDRAAHFLGYLYYTGSDGFPEDKTLGKNYFGMAAKAGNPDALTMMAAIYEEEEYSSHPAINEFLRAAARQDAPMAMYLLAKKLRNGIGILEDKGKAIWWLLKGVELGSEECEGLLNDIRSMMGVYDELYNGIEDKTPVNQKIIDKYLAQYDSLPEKVTDPSLMQSICHGEDWLNKVETIDVKDLLGEHYVEPQAYRAHAPAAKSTPPKQAAPRQEPPKKETPRPAPVAPKEIQLRDIEVNAPRIEDGETHSSDDDYERGMAAFWAGDYETAYKALDATCMVILKLKNRYPKGQAAMGWMQETGTGGEQDRRTAYVRYRIAARNGNLFGKKGFLRLLPEQEDPSADDLQAAKTYMEELGTEHYAELYEQVCGDGRFTIYLDQFKKNQLSGAALSEALCLFMDKAKEGDAEAAIACGDAYCFGRGVEPDLPMAAKYWRQGFSGKKADEAYAYGEKFYNGKNGVPENHTAAAVLYLIAAEQGDLYAATSLGHLFREGDGVEKNSQEAKKWYTKAAKQGDRSACYSLSLMYFIGDGIEKNNYQARKWMKPVAETGLPRAAYFYALMQEEDNIMNDETVTWLEKAAEQKLPEAIARLGLYYHRGHIVDLDERKAVKLWQQAAALGDDKAPVYLETLAKEPERIRKLKLQGLQGDNAACMELAACYLGGKGVARNLLEGQYWRSRALAMAGTLIAALGAAAIKKGDYSEAAKYLGEAAELDSGEAAILLAGLYEKGIGVAQDDAKAVELWEKAFSLGKGSAAYDLGFAYFQGRGVRRDVDKALDWFRRGAEYDEGNCALMAGRILIKTDEGKICSDQGVEYLEQAFALGEVEAATVLGNAYYTGLGTEKSPKLAVHWYKQGSDAGLTDCNEQLGQIYDRGLGVEVDKTLAFAYYKLAADQGSAFGCAHMGIMYYNGEGTTKNTARSKEYLQMAANSDDSEVGATARRILEKYF